MRGVLYRFIKARRLSIAAIVLSLATFNYLSDGILWDVLFHTRAVPEDQAGAWDDHPVVLMHQNAEAQFRTFLARQSKTPGEAEKEYTRRYHRPPPPGFRQWADYALAHGSPVIDDFDAIANGVHPFLKYDAAEIKRRVRSADEAAIGRHTGICEFAGGKFGPGCRSWADPLARLLGDTRQSIPDVDLLINFLDEPSALPEEQKTQGSDSSGSRPSSQWTDLSHHSIAAAVAEACRARGAEPRLSASAKSGADDLFGIHFVSNATAERDLCQHPEYASRHGFVMCPPTLHRLSSEVPVLSRAAPYPFSDILLPATHYSLKSSLYSSWSDRPWHSKRNAVYWTGSSTGGEWSLDTWRRGHRQRLVALATGKERRQYTLLDAGGGAGARGVRPYTVDATDTSFFDVGLTRIVGCASASVCDELTRFFGPPRRSDPESRPLRYRYALDIDGNSFSGRFYRLLASRSVPLKVTIFREWHDERLFPWLHYVPVSVGMEELPELVRFLTSTAAGQRISRRIADAGREWYTEALAPKHQGIYLYRLMLEMARLQDGSRDAS